MYCEMHKKDQLYSSKSNIYIFFLLLELIANELKNK